MGFESSVFLLGSKEQDSKLRSIYVYCHVRLASEDLFPGPTGHLASGALRQGSWQPPFDRIKHGENVAKATKMSYNDKGLTAQIRIRVRPICSFTCDRVLQTISN